MAPVDENDVATFLSQTNTGLNQYYTAEKGLNQSYTAEKVLNQSYAGHKGLNHCDLLNNNSIEPCRRAASEYRSAMSSVHLINRASSLGPMYTRKNSLTECNYECNYETIDGYSSGKSEDSTCAIQKLEKAVKSLDKGSEQ